MEAAGLKKIFVCSPFRGIGNTEEAASKDYRHNIALAKGVCRYISGEGGVPYCPHLYFPRFLMDADPDEREMGMGNAEERAFFTGDGDKKPLGILAETGGAELGVTAASEHLVTFDEIFDLYYSLKSPYRRNAQFVCNETLLLQLMKLKDKNDNYIWKPGLDTAKPDTILGRPIRTSTFMPTMSAGERVLLFGDLKNYWVADRQNRTFRRLNELYARTDQVGFMTTQRVDGRLILPESVKVLKMAGIKPAPAPTPEPDEQANG